MRLYGAQAGDTFELPIGAGGGKVMVFVAGIWRDYGRQQGAIMIDTRDYTAITGDAVRTEASVELMPGASAAAGARILALLPPALAGRVDFAVPAELRELALRLFDRSFAITYVLEAIAILVGLAGVAATFLRPDARTHQGVRHAAPSRHGPRPDHRHAALEGALLGLVGIAAGIALGTAMSQILIHVVNPQSFNWTMTTRVPWALFLTVTAALVATAAATAMIAGRRAVSLDAVRAVREDW